MRDGVEDGFRRAFKQIGEADEDFAFAQADGGVQRSEAAEADMDGRHGRARAERAVLFLKDGSDVGGHEEQNNSVSASASVSRAAHTHTHTGFTSVRRGPGLFRRDGL